LGTWFISYSVFLAAPWFRQDLLEEIGTANERTGIWERCLREVERAPLLGPGAIYDTGAPISPHNALLSIGVASGVPGMCIATGAFVVALMEMRRKRIAGMSLLILFFTSAITLDVLMRPIAWLALGLALSAASRIAEESPRGLHRPCLKSGASEIRVDSDGP
jgi:O-antigen ligase